MQKGAKDKNKKKTTTAPETLDRCKAPLSSGRGRRGRLLGVAHWWQSGTDQTWRSIDRKLRSFRQSAVFNVQARETV